MRFAAYSLADVATWSLHRLEVRREWNHIDVLLILTFSDDSNWVVCIENKVARSSRELRQLSRLIAP